EQMDYENRLFQKKIESALATLQIPPGASPTVPGSAPGQAFGAPPPSYMPPAPLPGETQTVPGNTGPLSGDQTTPPMAPGQLGSLTQSPAGTYEPLGAGATDADLYEQAYALLRDRDYDNAEKA